MWKTAAKWVARRLHQGRYVEVPHCKHEILMESDPVRDRVFAAFDKLASQVTSPSA